MNADTSPDSPAASLRPSTSPRATLVFLHGVGNGDPGGVWRSALSSSLRELGYPSLDEVRVIAPLYAHQLTGSDDQFALPPLTVLEPRSKDLRRENRRRAEVWARAVERHLGPQQAGSGLPGVASAFDVATELPNFEQAKKYVEDRYVRAAVLKRILAQLPKSGEVVIIGHSLGSVIAADLIRRLPNDVEVGALITIGSPLPVPYFQKIGILKDLKQPPSNLRWWMNVWDGEDLVTSRRGVSSHFPWMLDRRIGDALRPPKGPLKAHSAIEYLQDEAVAEGVAFALFGPRSQEVEKVNRELDLPLDEAESWAFLALRFAFLLESRLEGDKKARFQAARRIVQDQTFDRLVWTRGERGEAVPGIVMELAGNPGDPHAPAPEPALRSGFSKEEEVLRLLTIFSNNVIAPFEITVGDKQHADAFEELAMEMQLGKQFALDLVAASKDAQKALAKVSMGRFKWFFLGAGALLLVGATGGLALAAAPGVFGAAAITSALAAFGPGGMLGGLLTAGALTSVGGSGVALGLASSATSAEAFEDVVSLRLSIELARKRQGLDPDPGSWLWFEDVTIAVRREVARQREISDPKAKSMTEAQQKLDTLRRARRKLANEGLAPEVEVGADNLDAGDAAETGTTAGSNTHAESVAGDTADSDEDTPAADEIDD